MKLLEDLVRQDQNNSAAWYCLALFLDEPDKQIYCLKRVVNLDPSNLKAQQLLEKLQSEKYSSAINALELFEKQETPSITPPKPDEKSDTTSVTPPQSYVKQEITPLQKNSNRVAILIIVLFIGIVAIGIGFGYKLYTDKENAKREAETKAQAEKYIINFKSVTTAIVVETARCELFADSISSIWYDAIENGDDFNVAIKEAINFLAKSGQIIIMEQSKSDIADKMHLIQSPITGYEKPYELLVELYGYYTKICTQVTSPSGSLTTYNQDLNNNTGAFNLAKEKLKILLPDIKKSLP